MRLGIITTAIIGVLVDLCFSVGTDTAQCTLADTPVKKDHAILHCGDTDPLILIGSSTIFPVAEAHSINYANPIIAPQAFSTGTTLGFENFFARGSDIATASRQLHKKDYVSADCEGEHVTEDGKAIMECQGRLPVGVRVGVDLLSIIAHPQATWLQTCDITFEKVVEIFNTSVPKVWEDWCEGGPRQAPYLKIPDTKSGTRDFFQDITRLDFSNIPGFPDDQDLIQAIANNIAAIGFVGVGQASKHRNIIQLVNVSGISPLDFKQADNYNFSRSLYMYVDMAPKANNYQALEFVCSLLTDIGQQTVEKVGYLGIQVEELDDDRELLLCEDQNVIQRSNLKGWLRSASLDCRANRLLLIGSSTIYPLSVEAQRLFDSKALVLVPRSTSSSVAMQDLIVGAIPIAASSIVIQKADYANLGCSPQSIQETEDGMNVAEYPCLGALPRHVQVGQDMMAVIVSKNNTAFQATKSDLSLSIDDLKKLFVDKFDWSDVIPGALGIPANVYIPDAASGTRKFFEDVLGEKLLDKGYADDFEIVEAISKDPDGIGFVGIAYVDAWRVKAVSIDGISPLDRDQESIEKYALSRPLFYYYDANAILYNADVALFFCFILSDLGQSIVERVGYVRLSDYMANSQLDIFSCI